MTSKAGQASEPAGAAKPSSSTQPVSKAYAHDKTPRMPEALIAANAEGFHPSATPQAAARAFDRIILDAAARQKLAPVPLIGDEAFLRRVTIDLTGRIPTETERDAFLATTGTPSERRLSLVRHLMAGDRFVERWTVFFDDMLQVHSGYGGGAALHSFVIDSLRRRVSYDEMVRQMLTARGRLKFDGGRLDDPAVGYMASLFQDSSPRTMAGIVSQQLLGIRMSCAQCHDHPFDAWTKDDYDKVAVFFGRTSVNYYRTNRTIVVGLGDR